MILTDLYILYYLIFNTAYDKWGNRRAGKAVAAQGTQ